MTDGSWNNCELACHCNEDQLSITCNGAMLKFVPLGIPINTKTLTLSGNNFAVIGQEFRFLTDLVSINLQKELGEIISFNLSIRVDIETSLS